MIESADDNVVQTFQLESSNLRGRVVRLGKVLDDILNPHDYPLPVAHLIGEAVTMALLLSSMLKYEGVFTLQAQGDGPVNAIVSDVTSDMEVRGCAYYKPERLDQALEQIETLSARESNQNHLAQLLGKGYLAFTVDQGRHAERYQGIVDLRGDSMVDCMHHYFQQSEQIGTGVKMAVGRRGDRWRAGAIMLQNMPEDDQNPEAGAGNIVEDNWRRAMVLLGSCSEGELLDPDLHSNDLLYRLFHEEGVRVFHPETVSKGCRCSMERIENILMMMTERDRRDMTVNGKIVMTCEFCNRDFDFDPFKIERRIQDKIRDDS